MAHRFGGSQARRRLEELRSGWALDLALRPACFPPDPLPPGADRVTSMHGNWGTDGDYLRIAGDTFLSLEGPGLERPARRMAGCWHCAVAWTETRAGPREEVAGAGAGGGRCGGSDTGGGSALGRWTQNRVPRSLQAARVATGDQQEGCDHGDIRRSESPPVSLCVCVPLAFHQGLSLACFFFLDDSW